MNKADGFLNLVIYYVFMLIIGTAGAAIILLGGPVLWLIGLGVLALMGLAALWPRG